jgi:hypothetical protein
MNRGVNERLFSPKSEVVRTKTSGEIIDPRQYPGPEMAEAHKISCTLDVLD